MIRRVLPLGLLRGSRRVALQRFPHAVKSGFITPIPTPRAGAARLYASKSTVDEQIEEIQDQYATAKDEFEIAYEETEKMSVYAEDDRQAAREELDKLQEMFNAAASDPSTGEEVTKRIGQRIRELEQGVKAMEELAMNQD